MPSQNGAPHSASSQPLRERNIQAIVDYYLSGAKPSSRMGCVGIELEHTIVRDDLSPVPYSGDRGVSRILDEMRSSYPTVTRDAEGDIVGIARPGESVTIEPAAQIELSAGPFSDLHHARSVYDEFERTLAHRLRSVDARALATGYHPSTKALDLELIPKQRYKFMNAYLSKTDSCGPCMMRGSASTQVAIDYTDESDCLRKLRLAFALTPIFSLICDNSPIFEAERREKKLVRTHIWNHMDANRSGLVPGALSCDFTLRDYAAYILNTPAILVKNKETGEWEADDRTFGEIYAATPMLKEDIEHALSMLFTDVRLKTYIEIRPADAMPIPYAIAYAALIKGLFYSEENMTILDNLLKSVTAIDFDAAKQNLMDLGYHADVYGRPVGEWCDILMKLADAGLEEDERPLLLPLSRLVACRVTLADLAEANGFCEALCTDDMVSALTIQARELQGTK